MNLASYILVVVAGIVVAGCVIAGSGGAFTDLLKKEESIPKKLAIGAGTLLGGIWWAIITAIILGVIIAFVLNVGLEPAS